MSRSLLLMLCVVIGLLVIACGSPDTNKNAPADLSATNTAASPAPSAAATTPATAATQIGVPECDSFLTAYENCVTTKVPDAARPQFQTTMTTWRTEWKKLADNPQTRAGLVQACKMQMETARASMKAYNCTF